VIKNPWTTAGSSYDVQRADMWSIDCKHICDLVTTGYPDYVQRFAALSLANFSERQVTFPIQKTAVSAYMRGNSPVNMPGYDEPLENTRITFVLNAGSVYTIGDAATVNQAGSVYNLLYLWRQLVRQGRDEINGFDFQTGQLATTTIIPDYRCDIDIALISDYDTAIAEDDGVSHASAYTYYRLKNAWIAGLQLDNLDQDSSKPVSVTADIPAEDVIPL